MVPLIDQCAITIDAKVRDAVRALETSPRRLAVVVDSDGRLLGAITDGDIRRGILLGHGLDSGISEVMNRNPLTADLGASKQHLRDLLLNNRLEAIPLVGKAGEFSSVVHFSDLTDDENIGGGEGYSSAVIMAGGEGKRLRPLTNNRPKPMIEIEGVPLLERLVRGAVKARVPKVYIATNYLSEQIESYFKNGEHFGIPIEYLREDSKLGTAGALTLFDQIPTAPILVINGDVLTTSDYSHILRFHDEHSAEITIGVIEHRVTIPYGVVEVQGSDVKSLFEKPSQKFLCNAGIYVLSPHVLEMIPQNKSYDMPNLINLALKRSHKVCAFPIHEFWTDIGNVDDLARARTHVAAMEKDYG